MTSSEAETLIARSEGRLCVKFYQRRDGSIITRDCPVGLRAIRRRVSYVAKAVCSMLFGLLAGLGVHEAFSSIAPFTLRRTMGVMAERVQSPREIADIKVAPILGPSSVPIARGKSKLGPEQIIGAQKRGKASSR
jgi:hypothetical protein